MGRLPKRSKISLGRTLRARAGALSAAIALASGCGGRVSAPETGPDATTCTAAEKLCNGVCTDTSRDHANCGACGAACTRSEICSNGACVTNCAAASTKCASTCVDLTSDPTNCGACGTVCKAQYAHV